MNTVHETYLYSLVISLYFLGIVEYLIAFNTSSRMVLISLSLINILWFGMLYVSYIFDVYFPDDFENTENDTEEESETEDENKDTEEESETEEVNKDAEEESEDEINLILYVSPHKSRKRNKHKGKMKRKNMYKYYN